MIQKSKEVLKATGRNLMVLVKPSDHSNYKNLVDVLDEINITNVQTYAIVNISKEDINRLKENSLY